MLADFDAGVVKLLRMSPKEFQAKRGVGPFWAALARHPDFYGTLPLMPNAMKLFDAVKHLHPIILTGVPLGKWAAAQKIRWAAEHFPDTPIITILAREKSKHCKPGDVLVDDTLKYRELWEAKGGVFVHHQSVDSTLEELSTMFELSSRA